jgi:flagellar biosynthesis protein FliQ
VTTSPVNNSLTPVATDVGIISMFAMAITKIKMTKHLSKSPSVIQVAVSLICGSPWVVEGDFLL